MFKYYFETNNNGCHFKQFYDLFHLLLKNKNYTISFSLIKNPKSIFFDEKSKVDFMYNF